MERTAEALVVLTGDWYQISTRVDIPFDATTDQTEEISAKAEAFIKDCYGWDLAGTWFDCDISVFETTHDGIEV